MKAELTRRASLTDAVLALFRTNCGEWVSVRDLAKVGGFAAWRTRVADARKIIKAEGGTIENRIRRTVITEADGRTHVAGPVISEYRYLAHVPLGRAADVPAPDLWPTDGPYQQPFRLVP